MPGCMGGRAGKQRWPVAIEKRDNGMIYAAQFMYQGARLFLQKSL